MQCFGRWFHPRCFLGVSQEMLVLAAESWRQEVMVPGDGEIEGSLESESIKPVFMSSLMW